MLPEPALAPRSEAGPVDLLLVGGVTIDRFAGGRVAAGGSVLHGARAAAASGRRVGVITVAGPEPDAQGALVELARLTGTLKSNTAPASITFRHRESQAGRRLWLERSGGTVDLPPRFHREVLAGAILYAPVMHEIPVAALGVSDRPWRRAAVLQGWLRVATEGEEVQVVPPAQLSDEIVAALASLDVLIASREDLAAAAAEPHDQLRILRATIGPGPLLVVTDGEDGAWFDIDRPEIRRRRRWHLAVPRRVDGVATTGAGDVFAALFVLAFDENDLEVSGAAASAMSSVADILEARRS
jgi:sugar/nucleoside kinase (ribokinase family)